LVLGFGGHTLGADAALVWIDGDEDLAGPAAGGFVLPAVVTKLAADFSGHAFLQRLGGGGGLAVIDFDSEAVGASRL